MVDLPAGAIKIPSELTRVLDSVGVSLHLPNLERKHRTDTNIAGTNYVSETMLTSLSLISYNLQQPSDNINNKTISVFWELITYQTLRFISLTLTTKLRGRPTNIPIFLL